MPAPGARTTFAVVPTGGGTVRCQWYKDGQKIPGATGPTFALGPVSLADGGAYWATVTDGAALWTSPTVDLLPADRAWVVTRTDDSGPGTLRDALEQAARFQGANGVRFDLGPGPRTITLAGPLPVLSGQVRILGPAEGLTLDGGGDPANGGAGGHRPFLVDGGTLVLVHFTVRNGLAQGGGSRGGGAAAGLGGALFIQGGGAVTLVRMTFQDNRAQGGASLPGLDGDLGGGGGCGGDARAGGAGGPGLLGERGAAGYLDGSHNGDPALFVGAGGGAARGGTLDQLDTHTWQVGATGGTGDWGGGGGFSVGPAGGGGDGGFGGGGGGSGGQVHLQDGRVVAFPGTAHGVGGLFAGDGGLGDGTGHTGLGGGGAGLGGAIFLRAGTLALTGCVFTGNVAAGGAGAEAGQGKGGALFILPPADQAPVDPVQLRAQTYRDNRAAHAGPDHPATDNDDFYLAQEILPQVRTLPVQVRP